MNNKLFKYKIGLAVIGVLTLVLLVVVAVGASGVKQDNQSYKKATAIAEKLNNYIYDNYKIPETLSDAGITDVPSTVRYEKDSETEYKFCVTYKSASEDLSSFGNISDAKYTPSTLYLRAAHQKGENCQTVKPYLNTYDNYNTTGSSTGSTDSYYQ
jgi:hypothetical protein